MSSILVLGLNPTLQKTLTLGGPSVKGGVNRLSESLLSIGGKGANTARMITQLGGAVHHITLCGGPTDSLFRSLLEKEPFDSSIINTQGAVRFCYTHLVDEPFSATEFVESGSSVTQDEVSQTRDIIINCLSGVQWLVIAGSSAPGFGDSFYREIAEHARSIGCGVILDIQGKPLVETLPYSQVVKINMYEFVLSFMGETPYNQRISGGWYDRVEEKASAMAKEYGTSFVLTNGSDDTLVVDSCLSLCITPEEVLEPKNPIGSGDAVTAGVAYTLAQGGTLFDGAQLGMDCARKNLMVRTTGTIVSDE